jgi:hypothetical protein
VVTLVELLDAAMVCAARRGSTPGPVDHRRSTRLDENLGDFTDVIDTHVGRDPVYRGAGS